MPRSNFSRAWLVMLLLSGAAAARAQTGVLRGIVTDSANAPLPDADVAIESLHRFTRTDAGGKFSIDKLPAGVVEVTVRRLGYAAQTQKLTVSNAVSYSYSISLASQAVELQGMSVSERRQRLGVQEFYERRARGIGTFFTRNDLLERGARAPSDMLRSTPGVRFVPAGMGQGIRFLSPSNGRSCMPRLWIDGQLAKGMELDDISVNDIEGMELYQSLSTTPAQFWRGNDTPCGTIVVWSRTPGS